MGKILSRFLLWVHGWKVDKSYPKEAFRCVLVAAPHTSNWDGYILRIAMSDLGIPMKVAIKDFWTTGLWGPFIRYMGGVGISRKPKKTGKRASQTDMMTEIFGRYDDIALVVAPEGTRSARKQWKKGFYYVAKQANVPIALGYLDYKNKIAGIMPHVVHPSEDLAADMKTIVNSYKGIQGRNPGQFILDQRYVDAY